MDKLVAFFQNKWTKFGFSFLTVGYGAFLLWLAWLVFTHHLVPTNPVSLFALYLFINVMFGVLMIYTRGQFITQLVACLLHPCILAMLILAYGNWFLLIPPFAVATVVFFAVRSSETLKTILGTVYLILFVLGVIGYHTLQIFSINPFKIDIALRSDEYLYSPGKTYRVVKYIAPEDKENRTVSYYVEYAEMDLHLLFLDCERFYGAAQLHTARYDKQPEIKWLDDTRLLLDGRIRDVTQKDLTVGDDDEDGFSGETAIFTTSGEMTKATTTTPEPEETEEEEEEPAD